MSYHIDAIPKGVFGEFSKIQEEFLEAKDAMQQLNPLMVLQELSDLIGAIEAYASRHNISLEELIKMSEATKRAFSSGSRTSNVIEIATEVIKEPTKRPSPTMCIYGPKGRKVVYTDDNGYEHDREIARAAGCIKGNVYTVIKCDVGSWKTTVYLVGLTGEFNSVMFSDV